MNTKTKMYRKTFIRLCTKIWDARAAAAEEEGKEEG